MLKYLIIFIGLGCLHSTHAQKVLQKEWDQADVTTLIIDSDEVFTIDITASKTQKIRVYTSVEGETYESVVLRVAEKGNTRTIRTAYSPYFNKKDDKLAAHKVLAIDMIIEVPEGMSVEVRSAIASVSASGVFKELRVGLEDGNCDIANFLGNAALHTRQGAINVRALPGVRGTAVSKRGTVVNNLPGVGAYRVVAESVDGAISLLPTK